MSMADTLQRCKCQHRECSHYHPHARKFLSSLDFVQQEQGDNTAFTVLWDTRRCRNTRSEIDTIVFLDCTSRVRPAQRPLDDTNDGRTMTTYARQSDRTSRLRPSRRPSYGTKDGRTMTTDAMSILNVNRKARCNVVNGTPEHEEKSASHCLGYLTRHYWVTKNQVKEAVQASSLLLYDST